MRATRRVAIVAATGALAATGTAVAVAATGDDGAKRESPVLNDAAKRLGVTPEKLRDALGAAQDAQIDAAVKDGKLTKEQADRIKQARKEHGTVLGGPTGERHGMRMRGGPRRMWHGKGPGSAVADALGLSQQQLLAELRKGKSIAEIAKARGKSMADVEKAVEGEMRKKLDEAVKRGDLTRKQADRIAKRMSQRFDGSERPRLRFRMTPGSRAPAPPDAPAPPGAGLPSAPDGPPPAGFHVD